MDSVTPIDLLKELQSNNDAIKRHHEYKAKLEEKRAAILEALRLVKIPEAGQYVLCSQYYKPSLFLVFGTGWGFDVQQIPIVLAEDLVWDAEKVSEAEAERDYLETPDATPETVGAMAARFLDVEARAREGPAQNPTDGTNGRDQPATA